MSTTTGTWQLDAVHSNVGFEVGYLTGTFKGGFRTIEATLTVGENGARLEGGADVASVDVKDENFAGHLQTPDFFDAERHPRITFAADGIDLSGGNVVANGHLTMKGDTHPVGVTGSIGGPLTDGYGNERLGLTVSASFDRTAFGINWNAPLPTGDPALSSDITVKADLFFVKAR